MSAVRFLFLGGPWDQEWHTIGPAHSHPMYRVPIRLEALDPRVYRGHLSAIPHGGPASIDYYPRRIIVPGWRIPLTVFTVYPGTMPLPRGTVLPGFVEGEHAEAWPLSLRDELNIGEE